MTSTTGLVNLPTGLQQDVDLGSFNTLRVPAVAKYYLHAISRFQIELALAFAKEHKLPMLVLGGGSNLILLGDYPGLVLHIGLKGIHFDQLDQSECLVTAAAGENWHALVQESVEKEYRGIENLALIPGTVGASPVQNIGAYGVELKDSLDSVEVFDRITGQVRVLSNSECEFEYRHSLFKTELGRHLIILSITLRLSKIRPLQLAYADMGHRVGPDPSVARVMQTVIEIRQEKLPDPAVIPNVGSFFKNPIVDCQQYQSLAQRFPELVSYPMADGSYKLAAAWMIDRAGWKGYREGSVGVHDRQALVLVNPGHGNGAEVLALAEKIRSSVRNLFGIALEIEPVIC